MLCTRKQQLSRAACPGSLVAPKWAVFLDNTSYSDRVSDTKVNQTDVSVENSEPILSVVICTYNPDEKLLKRALLAVAEQYIPSDSTIECVIVDNNSATPVAGLACVRAFLERCGWARVVIEPRQGLTNARIAGIASTRASVICFVDDDNELAKGYFASALRILAERECIAVLGPGKVVVEYLEPVSEWFAHTFSHHFQERDASRLAYGSAGATWMDFYPPGSGMIVRRNAVEQYRQAFLAGRLFVLDREGINLSSGGDTQIVWEATKMGLAAGISPELQLTHIVPASRSNLRYIKRLCFGTSSSYLPALVNSFPSEKEKWLPSIPSNRRIIVDAVTIIVRHILRLKFDILPIALASFLGSLVGLLRASGSSERGWIYRWVEFLELK